MILFMIYCFLLGIVLFEIAKFIGKKLKLSNILKVFKNKKK